MASCSASSQVGSDFLRSEHRSARASARPSRKSRTSRQVMVSPVTPYDPGQPCCRVSGSGSGMGAASFRQTRSDAVSLAVRASLSWADMLKQGTRTPARPVRDEEAAGSNPATPTRSHQVRVAVLEKTPTLSPLSGALWRNPGEDLWHSLQDVGDGNGRDGSVAGHIDQLRPGRLAAPLAAPWPRKTWVSP